MNGQSGVWCDSEHVNRSRRRQAKAERRHKVTDGGCLSGLSVLGGGGGGVMH